LAFLIFWGPGNSEEGGEGGERKKDKNGKKREGCEKKKSKLGQKFQISLSFYIEKETTYMNRKSLIETSELLLFYN